MLVFSSFSSVSAPSKLNLTCFLRDQFSFGVVGLPMDRLSIKVSGHTKHSLVGVELPFWNCSKPSIPLPNSAYQMKNNFVLGLEKIFWLPNL